MNQKCGKTDNILEIFKAYKEGFEEGVELQKGSYGSKDNPYRPGILHEAWYAGKIHGFRLHPLPPTSLETKALKTVLDMADALTKKFIEKCESRRAFSVETLKDCREFQEALEAYRADTE